jgi:hypothetical protein
LAIISELKEGVNNKGEKAITVSLSQAIKQSKIKKKNHKK